jgi:hypothetical protein
MQHVRHLSKQDDFDLRIGDSGRARSKRLGFLYVYARMYLVGDPGDPLDKMVVLGFIRVSIRFVRLRY